MENEKKNGLSEEHLRKIKHRVGYTINESPRYRPLVTDGEEFDEVPNINPNATLEGQPVPSGQNLTVMEAGDQEPPLKPQGEQPPEPDIDDTVGLDDAPVPEFDETGGTEQIDAITGNEAGVDPALGMAAPDPSQQVDELQNEIIRLNTEAMRSIHDQLEGLNGVVQGLNMKFDELDADVEEVREPTNSEKLMSKTNVSYPYYFNLNDFWKGNWFDERNGGDDKSEQGIRELPDGTFVAEFDDLPQKSKIDVQDSFNNIGESVVKKKSKLNEEEFGGADPSQSVQQENIPSQIDGRSKQSAKNLIYKHIEPLTKGFFSDEGWGNVNNIWNKFNELGLDWGMNKNSEYYGGMPPQGKTWYIEIDFVDNNGRPQKINGYLTAAGAGSVEDPLDRYDITVVLS